MKNILLIIDTQNGFLNDLGNRVVAQRIEGLLKTGVFSYVIASRFINKDGSLFEKNFSWFHMKTDDEIQVAQELNSYIDKVTDKYGYSCITNEMIETLKDANDGVLPYKVHLVGLDIDCCVLATAISLFELGIQPVVLTYYCDTCGGSNSNIAGLTCLKRLISEGNLNPKEILCMSDL